MQADFLSGGKYGSSYGKAAHGYGEIENAYTGEYGGSGTGYDETGNGYDETGNSYDQSGNGYSLGGDYSYGENYGENYQENYQGDYGNDPSSYDKGSDSNSLNQDDSRDNRERDRDRSRRKHRERRSERRHGHEKERSKTRERDRDRDRGRDGRDSRDKRDRDRDRSSLRDSDRYDDYDENDSPGRRDSFERHDSRESRDGRGEERGGEKWMTDTPTNTILLRGLAPLIEEKDIRAELMMFGAPIKDVRLMRRSTDQDWLELTRVSNTDNLNKIYKNKHVSISLYEWSDGHYQRVIKRGGQVMFQNQTYATMHYSTPKTGQDKGPIHKTDWTCSKCGVHNFKRRDHCFKCSLSREESDKKNEADGFDQVGTNPCNTLIFRGLDALTTEDNLVLALSHVTSAGLKNIQIIRDQLTNTSRGYGFLEMNSVMESTQLLETLTQIHPPFEVDGKQILVSFAKNTFSTVMATLRENSQQSGYDYSQQQGYYDGSYYQGGEYDQSQYYEGQYDYSQYYDQQQYQQQPQQQTTTQAPTAPTQTDSTNAAAAVAQAAIQAAQSIKHYNKQSHGKQKMKPQQDSQVQLTVEVATAYPDTNNQEYPIYPPPDVSTYQYDDTSGYYFDPQSGLYYDASSQYYYNAQTQQFLYWDAERSTYLPAPNGDEQKGDENNEPGDKTKRKEEKKEKVKVAKKIAKDMEKWAKTLNAQKEAIKGFNKTFQNISAKDFKESATADAGYAILEKSAKGSLDDKKLMPPPPSMGGGTPTSQSQDGSKPHLVASYGGDSDSDNDDESGPLGGSGPTVDESKLSDYTKLACLLCKRQFQTKEILIKHTQMSDLHKQNLEALCRSRGISNSGGGASDTEKQQYRDRAKERREKYGIPPPPEPKKRQDRNSINFEQPNNTGIQEGNIGNKLLQKMGWSAGQGLGRAKQGIVKPIEASRRSQGAGLGMRGAAYAADAGDTYKDAVKKTLFARYKEIE